VKVIIYPIVCCVSTENRKQLAKLRISMTQGMTPWLYAINHHISANPNQDNKKFMENTKSVHRHCASTNVVKMSCK